MTHPTTFLIAAAMLSAVAAPASALTLTLRGDSLLAAFINVGQTSFATGSGNTRFEPFSERTSASFEAEQGATTQQGAAAASIRVDAADGSIRARATSTPRDSGIISNAGFLANLDFYFDITGDAPLTLEPGWLQYRVDGLISVAPQAFSQAVAIGNMLVRSRSVNAPQGGSFSDIVSLGLNNVPRSGNTFQQFLSLQEPRIPSSTLEISRFENAVGYDALLSSPAHILVPGEQLVVQLVFSGLAFAGISDGLTTALLGLTLPTGVTVDTSILGPDTPAWLGRDLSGPVQPIPVPPAMLLAMTGFGLLGAFRGRRR